MRAQVANRLARFAGVETAGDVGDDELTSLALAFGLSPLEIDALCLLLGASVMPELAARFRGAPTAVEVLALLVPRLADRLAVVADGFPDRLVEAGLVRPLGGVESSEPLILTRRARAILLGSHPLAGLPRFARRVERGSEPAVAPLIDPARLADALRAPGSQILVVTGRAGIGKTTLLRAVADRLGREHVAVDVALAASLMPPAQLGAALGELVTDAALAGAPILLDPIGGLRASVAAELCATLDRVEARVLIAAGDEELPPSLRGRAALTVELGSPRPAQRAALWRHASPEAGDAEIADVAETFDLTPRQIREAATQTACGISLRDAAAAQLTGGGSLLEPTTTRRGLDSLILPEDTRRQLDEVLAAVRGREALMHDGGLRAHLSRGRGLSALFDGEPGTGKTAACEALALEAGRALVRVNLSTVVDKYVGETEKNLTRVFAQARARGAILMFDEADALFAARTSVNGANDRFANLEVNLLLQLMEEHTGIVFLTTNLKANLDPALLRRVTFKVEFERPEAELRAHIWAGALPPALFPEAVDLEALANDYPLAGGGIQAAALRAAYRAAGEGRHITDDDLHDAAERECQAMGIVVKTIRRINGQDGRRAC